MSTAEILQAQQTLSETIERAQIGEDRQLAANVRAVGEQVARLWAGILRLPKLYDLANEAFIKPTTALVSLMRQLRELLGSVHLVAVEGQVYVNDIRIRFDLANDTPRHLDHQLRRHGVGGISFHGDVDARTVLALVKKIAGEEPAPVAPRKHLQAWLNAHDFAHVELQPVFRFVLSKEEQARMRQDVAAAYNRSSQVAGELYANLAMGRSPNTVAVRRMVTDLVDMDEGDQTRALADNGRDAQSPAAIRHAVQVSNLSVLVGRELGLTEGQLSDLGVCAFMHDVGYTVDEGGFPPPFERHGTAGAAQLLGQRGFHESRIRRLLVTLQHHLPFNSPRPPSMFSRIVRVADDFDTLTRFRQGGPLMAPPDAIATMWGARGRLYDPVCIQALVNRLGPYPPGTLLEIRKGPWVMVVSGVRSPELFDKPRTRVVRMPDGTTPDRERFLDLSKGGRIERVIRPRDD